MHGSQRLIELLNLWRLSVFLPAWCIHNLCCVRVPADTGVCLLVARGNEKLHDTLCVPGKCSCFDCWREGHKVAGRGKSIFPGAWRWVWCAGLCLQPVICNVLVYLLMCKQKVQLFVCKYSCSCSTLSLQYVVVCKISARPCLSPNCSASVWQHSWWVSRLLKLMANYACL